MDAAAKPDPTPDLAEQIAGALAWWREAGVDCDFTAQPQSWLAKAREPEAEPAPAAVTEPAVAELPARALPAALADLTAWWLADPTLDPGDPSVRVAPRGKAGAKVMVLVASPEHEDRERLLSGPQGRLLEALLGTLGWAGEEAYVASIAPRHDPMPDWPAMAQAGLGAIALHHVSLVAPERVLVLGSNVLSLLGHDVACKPQFFPDVNHDGRSFPLLAGMDLAALLAQPRLKAGLWGRLLDWTGS